MNKPIDVNGKCRLYLIRHGETEWSLSRQHTGRTDIALTANGENEARMLGKSLSRISFAHILTSPRNRARQTCALMGLDAVAEIEPDLAEWEYGDFEGKRSTDIREVNPNWNIYRDGCPNGEEPEQIASRAERLIARVSTLQGNIALFTHGQFSGVLAMKWIELPIELAYHFPLDTASLSILSFDSTHPQLRVIALWNFTPRSLQGTQELLR